MQKLVASKVIQETCLLSSRPVIYHLHCLPSAALYLAYGFLHFKFQLGSSEFAYFYLILTLFLHLLLFLVPQWSIRLKASLWYREASIKNSDSILVIPTVSNGKAAICEIERGDEEIWFLFQKKVIAAADWMLIIQSSLSTDVCLFYTIRYTDRLEVTK
jgi:hypothetical protein